MCDTYVKAGDDHKNMMIKTLTDRLNEVYSEQLYQEVIKEIWRYFLEEEVTVQQCSTIYPERAVMKPQFRHRFP